MAKTIIAKSIEEVCNDVQKRMIAAGKNTVNRVAATARNNAIKTVQSHFTLRNNFTIKQIQFTQCKGSVKSLGEIKSSVGVTERAEYMARQETGGAHKTKSGANIGIQTDFARGGSKAKPVKRSMRLDQLTPRIAKTGRKGSRKAALVARASIAGKPKSATPFIRLNNGIFKVSNFRRLKSGQIKFKTRLVYNFKFKETQTPAKPWLLPASEYAAQLTQQIFNQEMDKQQ